MLQNVRQDCRIKGFVRERHTLHHPDSKMFQTLVLGLLKVHCSDAPPHAQETIHQHSMAGTHFEHLFARAQGIKNEIYLVEKNALRRRRSA